MSPLGLVKLSGLMARTRGAPEIVVCIIDGPVATGHPGFAETRIREIPGSIGGACSKPTTAACMHGTFVAGVLGAQRGSPAPSICPDCTIRVRPIFAEGEPRRADGMPSATPEELAGAVTDAVDAGARVINLSASLLESSHRRAPELEDALDHALRRGVITVAAAGNDGSFAGSTIVRHPSVIPVAACDRLGRPLGRSNLSLSIARRGLSAPGDRVTSLGAPGREVTMSGTSAAAPFVTGAIALLWSEFPEARAADIRFVLTESRTRRTTVVPPLLDAWGAYRMLLGAVGRAA